jgi:hypothetical protein
MCVPITAVLCWLSAGAAFCQRGPAPFYGGHRWPNWQIYLAKYAPLLFRD